MAMVLTVVDKANYDVQTSREVLLFHVIGVRSSEQEASRESGWAASHHSSYDLDNAECPLACCVRSKHNADRIGGGITNVLHELDHGEFWPRGMNNVLIV